MIQSELHECLKDGRPLLEHGYFNTHEELFGVLERAHSATFAENLLFLLNGARCS